MFELQLFDLKSGARRSVPVSHRPLLIGGAIDCDLVLPGPGVAQAHCRVEVQDGALCIVDLGTEHETIVNGQAVSRAHLEVGDVIRIGAYQFAVLPARGEVFAPEVFAPEVFAPVNESHAPTETLVAASIGAPRPPPLRPSDVRSRVAAPTPSTPTGALVGLLVVAIAIGVVLFLSRDDAENDAGFGSPAARQADIHRVMELDAECRFDEALATLVRVIATSDGADKQVALDQELAIKWRKQRYLDGTKELELLRRRVAEGDVEDDVEGVNETARTELQRFIGRNGELAPLAKSATGLLAKLDQAARPPAVKPTIPEFDGVRLTDGMTLGDGIAEAEKWLGAEEFGKAHFILSHLPAANDDERFELAIAFDKVNSVARKLGALMLTRVDEQMQAGQLLTALAELDVEKLRRFEWTEVWYEMLDQADVVEDAVDAEMPDRPRTLPRRRHHRAKPGSPEAAAELLAGRSAGEPTAESAAAAASPGDGAERGARSGAVASAASASAARATLEQARGLIAACDFGQALHLLDLALDSAVEPELKLEIARDHERAARPLKLLGRIAELVAAKLPANADVELRDGRRATVTGSDGKVLSLTGAGATFTAEPGELSAAALLRLSGRLPLEGEEHLHRTFLALAADDDKAFFGSLAKVGDDSSWKGSVDSALTFQRGLEQVPPRGFVRVGETWITWEERAALQLANELRETLAALLDRKGDPEATRRKFLELAAAAPAVAVAQTKARRLELKAEFEAAPEQVRIARLAEDASKLAAARQHALALIFDEVKYFYPYSPPAVPPEQSMLYAEVQQEVDLRVDAVRTLWGRESEEPPLPQVTLSASFIANVEELVLVRGLLVDLGVASDDVDAALRPAYALPSHAKAVHLRNFARDEFEHARLDEDARVAALNATVRTLDNGASREELEQVRVTNLYRAMLGRRILAYNDKLWVAADTHSEWMSRTGQLSHFEDGDPARNSPEQRMALAGYKSGAGENCAFGRSGPLDVLVGWCHSSGHHRNLLFESHTEMAAGQSGTWWTQCFGGGREYKGNLIRD